MSNTEYYAYIRCSTAQQSYDRQYKQLNDFLTKEKIELDARNIYCEKRTGKNQDRPIFKELVETLKQKESRGYHCCLILVELSRMGRSYLQTKATWNELTKCGVDIVVTSFPLLDTRRPFEDVYSGEGSLKAMLVDVVFSVLNYLTEQELNEKADRCNNGRISAMSKGVKMGRKEMTADELPKEFIEVMKKATGNESKTSLLDEINGKLIRYNKRKISRGTFYNYLELYKKSQT